MKSDFHRIKFLITKLNDGLLSYGEPVLQCRKKHDEELRAKGKRVM